MRVAHCSTGDWMSPARSSAPTAYDSRAKPSISFASRTSARTRTDGDASSSARHTCEPTRPFAPATTTVMPSSVGSRGPVGAGAAGSGAAASSSGGGGGRSAASSASSASASARSAAAAESRSADESPLSARSTRVARSGTRGVRGAAHSKTESSGSSISRWCHAPNLQNLMLRQVVA